MSRLLKRVREWVWNLHTPPQHQLAIISSSSTGEVHRLPLDIFMQILKLLGPKEAARLASVCKSWKLMVSDDALWIYFFQDHCHWASVLFAETRLSSGFPLRTHCRGMLSLMHVYGERTQVPGAIIIDVGAGYCKIGWSKYDSPSIRFSTIAAFIGDNDSPLHARIHIFFEIIYGRMRMKPSKQAVILATPIPLHGATEASSHQLREAILSAMVVMRVPAVCAVSQASLALFASRRTWGILVNIGQYRTQVFPILNGNIKRNVGVVSVKVGGSKLSKYLRMQLQQGYGHVRSSYIVQSLKQNLCYVAYDYEAELRKNTEASYEVASNDWFTLNHERFQTGEILFQPQIAGSNEMGLHQAVALCVDRCSAIKMKTGHNWYKTIVLAGGTACLPGLTERLNKELRLLLPPSVSRGIRVIRSPYGADAAWHGAKMIGNLSSFRNSWCVAKGRRNEPPYGEVFSRVC